MSELYDLKNYVAPMNFQNVLNEIYLKTGQIFMFYFTFLEFDGDYNMTIFKIGNTTENNLRKFISKQIDSIDEGYHALSKGDRMRSMFIESFINEYDQRTHNYLLLMPDQINFQFDPEEPEEFEMEDLRNFEDPNIILINNSEFAALFPNSIVVINIQMDDLRPNSTELFLFNNVEQIILFLAYRQLWLGYFQDSYALIYWGRYFALNFLSPEVRPNIENIIKNNYRGIINLSLAYVEEKYDKIRILSNFYNFNYHTRESALIENHGFYFKLFYEGRSIVVITHTEYTGEYVEYSEPLIMPRKKGLKRLNVEE